MWLQAQQPGRSSKRGVPVFDEPLVNYMVGVREAARGERHWDKRPRLRVVDPVAVFPTRVNPPPPQAFPRVFEQRDILVDDPTPSPPLLVTPNTMVTESSIKSYKIDDFSKSLPTIHSSIIVRIYSNDKARWSTYELEQWIQYMRYAGVSQFYLYDTRTSDQESLKDWCRSFADIKYHDWEKFSTPFSLDGTQARAYQHAIDNYKDESDWQIAFDMDEYPFSPSDTDAGFLRRQIQKNSLQYPSVTEFSLKNYVFLGAPTAPGREFVIERIIQRTIREMNNLDKPIYRPKAIMRARLHHNELKYGRSMDLNPAALRINHYWGLRLQNWGEACSGKSCGLTREELIKLTVKDRSMFAIAAKIKRDLMNLPDNSPFRLLHGQGRQKYDVSDTAIGSMVKNVANFTRGLRLSTSMQDFWKWVHSTGNDERVVYVNVRDLDKLGLPSAQLLGPFMFVSRKKGYQFAGCCKNGTTAAFFKDSFVNLPIQLKQFDPAYCLFKMNDSQKALPLDFNFHHITYDTEQQNSQTFLTLCMPTMPRDGNVTYLTQVLAAYQTQLRDPLVSDTRLVVVNTRPAEHREFEHLKRRYRDVPQFWFAELSNEQAQWVDPVQLEVDNMNNPKVIPGRSVRRQTHDLVHVMDQCISPGQRGVFTMLVEDDFVPCTATIRKIYASVRDMQDKPGWRTLSFSIGMNGIVLQTETGVMQLRRFLNESYDVLPPDLLVYGHERRYQGKHVRKARNFFEHIGAVSSFKFRNSDDFLSAHAHDRAMKCAV